MSDITKITDGAGTTHDVRDANAVHTSGAETVDGVKTFRDDLVSFREGSAAYLRSRFNNMVRGDTTTYGVSSGLQLEDRDAHTMMQLALLGWSSDGRREFKVSSYADDGTEVQMMRLAHLKDGSITLSGAPFAMAAMPTAVGRVELAVPGSGEYAVFRGGVSEAPNSGWVFLQATATRDSQRLTLDILTTAGVSVYRTSAYPMSGQAAMVSAPVPKGYRIRVYRGADLDSYRFYFCKCSAEI